MSADAEEWRAARAVIAEANNSLYGSQSFFLSVNGGPPDKYHLARPIEELKERSNRLWREREELLKALKAMVLNDRHTYRDCHKAALAAIANATGAA